MRVLFLTSRFQGGYGVSLVVKKQVMGLLERGAKDVFVATPDASPSRKSPIRLLSIGMDDQSTASAILKVRPDIVVVHTPPYYSHVARFHQLETIKIAYDHGEPFPSFFEGEDRLLREAENIRKLLAIKAFHMHICISEFIKRISGFDRSTVLYNGADHITEEESKGPRRDIREILHLGSNAFIVSNLSRIGEGESKYKGFDIFKEVKRRLSLIIGENKAVFLLCGKLAPGGRAIQKDLEASGIQVLTDLNEDLKRAVLRQSDLFFSPSLWEGFNLPLVEAQYLGAPALALSTAAHPEVCPFHFPSVDELVQYVAAVYRNPALREKHAATCRDFVQARFRWKANAGQLLGIMTEAVANKQLPLLSGDRQGELCAVSRASDKAVLERHLHRIGLDASVEKGRFTGAFRIAPRTAKPLKISIIIPSRDRPSMLAKCISSILEKSTYRNFELIVIENGSSDPEIFNLYSDLEKTAGVRVIEWKALFNYSAVNNFGCETCGRRRCFCS